MFLSLATLFEGYPPWFGVTVAVVLVTVVAYLLAQLAARATHFLACRALGVDVNHRIRHLPAAPVRLVRGVVFLLLAVLLIFPALEVVGVRTEVGVRPEALARWLMQSGLRIGLIVLVSYLILKIVGMIARRLESEVEAAGGTDAMERLKRVRTLGTLVQNTLGALVTGIALLMVLRELNLDITPILTGAGIVGLAVGFGAQTLVKDVISGFFLILENQVRVGDVAAINGTGGLVEAITLRTIVLRDQAGTVHVFPNGSITTLSNMSKDFAYYVIDLGVAYDEDTDRVGRVLRSIDDELRADVVYGPSILEPLEILGIENFAESQITMRLRIKTLPLKQWDVGRELRRRIKIRFHAEGIVIPFRQLKLHVDSAEALRAATSGSQEPVRAGQE
jgi:small conductance mechanosensitive channel